MTEASTRRLRIFGLVQGVGYRASLVAEAERLGVTGWVRNRLDGSVEALIQGDAARLEQLASWARKGPRLASVTHVDVLEANDTERAVRFSRMTTHPTQ